MAALKAAGLLLPARAWRSGKDLSAAAGYLGAAFLLAVASGCATVRSLPNCSGVEQFSARHRGDGPLIGRQVVLAVGRFDPAVATDDTIAARYPRPQMPVSPSTPTAAGGAAVGALRGTVECVRALMIFPLCAAIMAPVGAVLGGVIGAVEQERANRPDAKLRQEMWEQRRREAIAQQRRVDEQLAVRSARQKEIAAIAAPVELNRLLAQEIRRHTLESEAVTLPVLPDQGPSSPTDEPRYQVSQDYVFEVTVIERIVKVTGTYDAPLFSLGLSARGRLIRAADNVVVRQSTTSAISQPRPAAEWIAEGGKRASEALDEGLQEMAKTAVKQWLRPSVGSPAPLMARIVIIRGQFPTRHSVPISVDGCLVGELANGAFLDLQLAAGKHMIRAEKVSNASPGLTAGELVMDARSDETRYFSLEHIRGREYFFRARREVAEEHIKRRSEAKP